MNCSIYSEPGKCAYCKSTHYLSNNECILRSVGAASPALCVAYENSSSNCSLCEIYYYWTGTLCAAVGSEALGTGLNTAECDTFSRDGLSCLKCVHSINGTPYILNSSGLCIQVPAKSNCIDYDSNGDCICCDS